MTTPMNRRVALKTIATGLAAPFVYRTHTLAAPSETIHHASFGAGGMALADLNSLTASKNIKLVAVADVDTSRFADIKKRFPDIRCYQDWRELLDKEKTLVSANISTPDHMHAPITMQAIQQGLHVYTQKPLTQTIFESRQLMLAAREKKILSQMGIQIHSHEVHKSVVKAIQDGIIGKVSEIHSWSGKQWGDNAPLPMRKDMVPASLDWNGWLGVAADRPYLSGQFHPGNWRKRLDFGTGTFGDMGCHILDPVYGAVALTAPKSVQSTGEAPNKESWALNQQVQFIFPQTPFTTPTLTLNWYNGNLRPSKEVLESCGIESLNDQGSIYIGTEGVLYSPYIAMPTVTKGKNQGKAVTKVPGENHYLQFVEAIRGNAKTSAPFDYAAPLTEMVLLGCLSTRFPKTKLEWDADAMKITNHAEANPFVRREYRKGWEVAGL